MKDEDPHSAPELFRSVQRELSLPASGGGQKHTRAGDAQHSRGLDPGGMSFPWAGTHPASRWDRPYTCTHLFSWRTDSTLGAWKTLGEEE